MDSQVQTPRVTVGVDGRADNVAALHYAAAEALTLGATLELVHVAPDHIPIAPRMPQAPVDLSRIGASILEEARARAAELAPEVPVEISLRHGGRAAELALAARGSTLLVVGRDGRALVERVWRGNTTTGVAARATVPVVEVPAGWQSNAHGVVVAGVKSRSHASDLLAEAFAVAHQRHASLVVLHAWRLPSVYDDIIEARVDLETLHRDATAELETLAEGWRTAYPDVSVRLEVVHDHAGHALVDASRAADVVVLARRMRGFPPATHLGGTARAVLRAAQCPVRVVAPAGVPPSAPLVLERDGELAR